MLGTERTNIAERGIIGAILCDENCIDVAMEMVRPCDMTDATVSLVYGAMIGLRERGIPINIATVIARVGNEPAFVANGGLNMLTDAPYKVGHPNEVVHLCSIVRSEAIHRRLLAFSEMVRTIRWENVDSPDSEIARLADELGGICEGKHVTPWTGFDAALAEACREIASPEPPCTVATGFCDLDTRIQLRPGTLTIIAARPGIGKSALGINIMSHVGIDMGIPVAFFSLEMTVTEIVCRIISARARVNGNAIRTKHMTDDEWGRILDVAERYPKSPIYIDETPGLGIAELRARARRMRRQHGIACIIVDYLQLMHATDRTIATREQEVATVSRGLKQIAKELRIPVIALSQLNRQLETRADKHPVLSDLRESGAIEQDADTILFLHREHDSGEADLDIAKVRNGAQGRIRLSWEGSFTRFGDIAESHF